MSLVEILQFSDFCVSEKPQGRNKETHSRWPRQAHLNYTYKKLAYAGQRCLELVAAVVARIRDEWRECEAVRKKCLADCN